MPGSLQKLNRSHKIWIVLLTVLAIAIVAVAFQHKNAHTSLNNGPKSVNKVDSNFNNPAKPDNSSNQQQAAAVNPPEIVTAPCHMHNSLPDPVCTPGATDPRVTQANIKQTICVAGYTKTVRPPESLTSQQKKISMQQYGFTDSPSNHEYDHLISLELGGAPDDTKNLWPEPGASPNAKDKVEDKLHSLVCEGAIQLSEAQKRIASDWTTALSGLNY